MVLQCKPNPQMRQRLLCTWMMSTALLPLSTHRKVSTPPENCAQTNVDLTSPSLALMLDTRAYLNASMLPSLESEVHVLVCAFLVRLLGMFLFRIGVHLPLLFHWHADPLWVCYSSTDAVQELINCMSSQFDAEKDLKVALTKVRLLCVWEGKGSVCVCVCMCMCVHVSLSACAQKVLFYLLFLSCSTVCARSLSCTHPFTLVIVVTGT
jgi:hypothetical protein